MSLPAPVRDVALLLARVLVGIVFVAHGWQKLVTMGIDTTAGFFAQADVPLPTVSAWAVGLVELVGGAALIVGALVPVMGLLLAADMLGAYVFVHAGKGVFVNEGGFELVAALGAAGLVLAAVGAGRFSVDRLLVARRRKSAAEQPA